MYVLITVTNIEVTSENAWNQERFSIFLNKYYVMSTYWKVSWKANVGSRWRPVLSFTPQQLDRLRNSLELYWVGRKVGPRIGLDVVKK